MAAQISASAAGTVTIGGDLVVNRIGIGSNRITDTEEARALLRHAADLGVNHIDTADAYAGNESEKTIGKVFAPYDNGIVVGTKGGNTVTWEANGKPDYLKQAVDASLQRLQLEQIPLYYLHKVDPEVPLADSIGALKELRDAGKIKHVALSNMTIEQIEEANAIVPITAVQNHYNIITRGNEALVDYCESKQLVFLPYFPLRFMDADTSAIDGTVAELAERYGAERSQILLSWLLHRSPVMLPIPGTLSIEHLESNIGAGSIKLSDEDFETLDSITRPS